MKHAVFAIQAVLLAAPPRTPAQQADESGAIAVRVKLLSPLSSKLNRKGDMAAASVVEPAKYAGAILEGDVREVRPGASGGRPAHLVIEFHTLHRGAKELAVVARLVSAANSQGRPNQDERGIPLVYSGPGGSTKTRGTGPMKLTAATPELTLAVGSELLLDLRLTHK